MNILVLGGTGAMGVPLVDMLSHTNKVYVTSRKALKSAEVGKIYIQGNAMDPSFLQQTLSMHKWNVVVDFMVRSSDNLKQVLPLLLDKTEQYIFISSARVYAETQVKITEDTPRLLDVSKDTEYLKTNEYALAKAREENLLWNCGKKNFTIIRPSITYNTNRLQLGTLEKENWLYRALHGRSIVFSEDVNSKLTTMTFGDDVARGIASVIGREEALGEVFHITYHHSMLWSEVLEIYKKTIEMYWGDGRTVPVIITEKSTNLTFKDKVAQLVYCRYFNRTFDNSKIARFCDIDTFTPPEQGLSSCLLNFMKNPKFSYIDWRIEAVNDKTAKEKTPLKEIPSRMGKINYLLYRYNWGVIRPVAFLMIKLLKKVKRVLLK